MSFNDNHEEAKGYQQKSLKNKELKHQINEDLTYILQKFEKF